MFYQFNNMGNFFGYKYYYICGLCDDISKCNHYLYTNKGATCLNCGYSTSENDEFDRLSYNKKIFMK